MFPKTNFNVTTSELSSYFQFSTRIVRYIYTKFRHIHTYSTVDACRINIDFSRCNFFRFVKNL